MKFGKQLEESLVPEWKDHYINYTYLQKGLKNIQKRASASNGDLQSLESPDEPWFQAVTEEATHARAFVNQGLLSLEEQVRELTTSVNEELQKTAPRDEEDDDEGFSQPMLLCLDALGRARDATHRLRDFADLNHAALYKILKKHDKVTGLPDGLGKLLPKLVPRDYETATRGEANETSLGDTSRFDAIDKKLQALSQECTASEGLHNASAKVAGLAAGVGSHAGAKHTSSDLFLGFFLGSFVSWCLACVGLLALPHKSQHHFNVPYFCMPMPVYRVIFSVVLLLLCLGAVARTCDLCGINYKFIIKIDLRCQVKSNLFFYRAAVLGTLWVLMFGAYVVDFKWGIIGYLGRNHTHDRKWHGFEWYRRHHDYEEYAEGAAQHYVCYPVIAIAGTLAILLWPSTTCRNKYKWGVLGSLQRTMCAPLFIYPVDFLDNMVGDILTSLAKPLQDMPAAYCYLTSPHPVPESVVKLFVDYGTTCTDFTQHVVVAFLIAGFPYVLRAFQCLSRFRETSEKRHLWNFGKYLSCLSVVVVSFCTTHTVSIVIVSIIATVYAFTWDVMFDWGLGRADFFPTIGVYSGIVSSGVKSYEEDEPSVSQGRLLSRRTYCLCTIFDLLARSAWVLTLMPAHLITRNLAGSVVLVSFMSSIEILRRSMWAVLRIECEQMTNASGFRTLLWVPSKSKLNKSNIQRQRSSSDLTQPLL